MKMALCLLLKDAKWHEDFAMGFNAVLDIWKRLLSSTTLRDSECTRFLELSMQIQACMIVTYHSQPDFVGRK
jgi:hypothetical protein